MARLILNEFVIQGVMRPPLIIKFAPHKSYFTGNINMSLWKVFINVDNQNRKGFLLGWLQTKPQYTETEILLIKYKVQSEYYLSPIWKLLKLEDFQESKRQVTKGMRCDKGR